MQHTAQQQIDVYEAVLSLAASLSEAIKNPKAVSDAAKIVAEANTISLEKKKEVELAEQTIAQAKADKAEVEMAKSLYNDYVVKSNKEIKEKIVNSNIEKYGVKTTLLVPEVQEKIKQTLIDRYDVDHPNKNKELRQKGMDTCLEKYGHVIYAHSIEGRTQVRKTLKERYNVASIAQLKYSQEVRDLLQDTKRFHDEYYSIGITGICEKYPELNYNMCRAKLLREGINDVITYTKPEHFIKDILDEYNIEYEYNTRKVIPPQELDFYIPGHNLAIEVCGLYWHRHELLKDAKYHIKKLEACLEGGGGGGGGFSDQIEEKSDIVKERIKSKLKLLPRIFHARKLHITDDYNRKDINNFIAQYHIQGSKCGNANIVALDNGYICAAMTFGPLRRSLGNKNPIPNSYEMYRFVSAGNIPGIASRLFKFFVNKYQPSHIISFSDRCWGEGELYGNLGFTKVQSNGPNYWYTKDYVHKIHRFGFTKHSLVAKGYDSNKTESQIMESLNYGKIYDCGSIKYIWSK